MKKVVCARCELVNLDTFPAFPLCEACGARLPSPRHFRWRGPLRRPALPLAWAVVLGAGAVMLALLSVGLARDPREGERGTLVLGGQSVPDPANLRAQIWTVTLAPTNAGDQEPIRSLRLRLSRKDEHRWGVSVLSPKPEATHILGGGRYYDWSVLPRGTALRLRLMPPEPNGQQPNGQQPNGQQPNGQQGSSLRLWWTAEGFEGLPLEVRSGGDEAGGRQAPNRSH